MCNRQEDLLLHIRQLKLRLPIPEFQGFYFSIVFEYGFDFVMNNQNGYFVLQMLARNVACKVMGCEIDAIVQRIAKEGRSQLLQQVWLSVFAGVLRVCKSLIAENFTSQNFWEERHQRMLPELIFHFCHAENLKRNGPRGANRGSLSDLNYTSFNTMSFVHSHHKFKLVAQVIQSCSKETKQMLLRPFSPTFLNLPRHQTKSQF